MPLKVSETEFLRVWAETGGSAAEVSRRTGLAIRSVHKRRVDIEKRNGILPSLSQMSNRPKSLPPGRLTKSLENGTILVGSDAHIWTTDYTTAQRGFIAMAAKLKPDIVVINGDLFDGATVSRHPRGIWEQERRPSVKQEVEACQAYLTELQKAAGAAFRVWTIGNHDARYEMRLAALTPEYEGVAGFALKDHFPEWAMCMSLWVNDQVVIKHRAVASGLHAVYQNTLKGGKSIVTGHLHSLKVTPWTDYNGTRYGVDTGTLSDPYGSQFDYAEDNPRNWRSGFAVLTFRDGKLLLPELAQVWDEGLIQFRGELIPV